MNNREWGNRVSVGDNDFIIRQMMKRGARKMKKSHL